MHIIFVIKYCGLPSQKLLTSLKIGLHMLLYHLVFYMQSPRYLLMLHGGYAFMKTGATETISESFRKYLNNIWGKHEIKEVQKTAILFTAHMLWEVPM